MGLKSTLQPHQERAVKKFLRSDQPGLVLAHSTGTGKTLSSIAAQAASGLPADVVVPAALMANYRKELEKHLSEQPRDTEIHSLERVARGGVQLHRPLLVIDEAHRGRNPQSAALEALKTSRASKRLVLTASPLYNQPSDIAPLVNIAAGKQILPETSSRFRQKYVRETEVKPSIFGKLLGVRSGIKKSLSPGGSAELRGILNKWVDFAPQADSEYPSKTEEIIPVTMGTRQQDIHDAALNKAPFWVRWKVLNNLPPSKQESGLLNAFMSTSRQVSTSTSGFHEGPPDSPKIDTAFKSLQKHLGSSPRSKAVVYSSFVRSGIEPYRRRLEAAGIPHGEFSGRVPQRERKKLIEDFNEGRKKVLLLSRAGAEGLDLKGTRLIQVMEPHWNEENIKQVIGRGRRYRSHAHLPPAERNVHVQRFVSRRRPQGVLENMGIRTPGASTDEYIHNRSSEKEDLNRQFRSLLNTRE